MLAVTSLLSAYICEPLAIRAPARAVAMMASKYPEYVKEQELKRVSKQIMALGVGGPPTTFGASSALIDDADLMSAAREAAEAAGHAEKFSASEIVIAFNSWKLSRGLSYKSKEDAAVALRTFAADYQLIETHLEAAQSALFNTEVDGNALMPEDLDANKWRTSYKAALETKDMAEQQRQAAIAGQQAAEDKLRQALSVAAKQEKSTLAAAQVEYLRELQAAEERAATERSRLAMALAQVAVDEKEAREAAQKKLDAVRQEATQRAANAIANAQADRTGAAHKWSQTEEVAIQALRQAEEDMTAALLTAQKQQEAARVAAEKKAALVIAAQSEAKALLELLKQSKEEAAAATANMEKQMREMQNAVDLANKRARKAKLAAAAALEEL